MKRKLLAVIAGAAVIAAVPVFGRGKKMSGEILDQQGFQGVHSYCAQVQDLSPHYAEMVKSFFKEQDKSKSLVSQLPWKMVDDCSQADAVMTFKWSETQEPSQATAGGSIYAGGSAGTVNTTWLQVTAVVTGRSSQKEVYEVQGPRAPERGERAMEKTFRSLAKDLKSNE